VARCLGIAVLAGAFVLMGACTGEIMQSRIDRPGADGYFRYGASPGEMLAVVIGNPFLATSKKRLEQIVTDTMFGNHSGPSTRFSTQPGPLARKKWRIVMLLNPERAFHIDNLCNNPSEIRSLPMEPGKRLRLYAGFCVQDSLYSHAKISIPAVATPDTREFRGMVSSAMWELVPSRDPFDIDSKNCAVTPCG
jgi:hypothetical protein